MCVGTPREQQQKQRYIPKGEYKKGERNEKQRWVYIYVFFNFSHIDIREVERNETHVTLQCETNLRQIIWKIGKTQRFEARQYERNGSSVTATTTILVNETVNATCIAKTQLRSEMDRLTLHPYEGLCNLNTIHTYTLLSTYVRLHVSALEGNECRPAMCIQCMLY